MPLFSQVRSGGDSSKQVASTAIRKDFGTPQYPLRDALYGNKVTRKPTEKKLTVQCQQSYPSSLSHFNVNSRNAGGGEEVGDGGKGRGWGGRAYLKPNSDASWEDSETRYEPTNRIETNIRT